MDVASALDRIFAYKKLLRSSTGTRSPRTDSFAALATVRMCCVSGETRGYSNGCRNINSYSTLCLAAGRMSCAVRIVLGARSVDSNCLPVSDTVSKLTVLLLEYDALNRWKRSRASSSGRLRTLSRTSAATESSCCFPTPSFCCWRRSRSSSTCSSSEILLARRGV